MKHPTILIVGYGSIGQRHAKNLYTLGVSKLIVLHSRKNKKYSQELPSVTHVFSLAEALKHTPTIAFITNPTNKHIATAQALATAGCHLFIEKPLSNSTQGVSSLIKTIRRKKIITMIGCNQRFHPQLQDIYRRIHTGEIGNVLSANFTVGQYLPDWHPQEDYRLSYAARRKMGGGPILTLIHELDYADWLLGPFNTVTCVARRTSKLKIDTEDTAAIILTTKRSSIIEVHADYIQRAMSRKYEIHGTKGSLVWDYTSSTLKVFNIHKKNWVTTKIQVNNRNDMFLSQTQYFLKHVAAKTKTMNPVENAFRILKIALLAKQSSLKKRLLPI